MPANVSPEYEKAELRFRAASSDDEKLDALQEMLRTLPKHKGTEKMQADLKRRISQLRKAGAKKSAAKKGPDPFHVPKGGAGQVILLGAPNCGKSMLVATTTNASVKVAEYPYTTALPAPGMWMYEDAPIELVDTPPITAEHVPPGLTGTIRSADMIAIVIDAAGDGLEELDMVTSHLTERGLALQSIPRNELDPDDPNQRSAIVIANKADLAGTDDIAALRELADSKLEICPVSAATGEGLDRLCARLWQLLAVIRVYTKRPGKKGDLGEPFTLPAGSTIEDLAAGIHRELPEKMKFARIWGEGRFDGQQVHRTELLHDKDIVEIHE
ncbi:MAG: GTPase [Planctomycetota bacterium]|jgi:ribosome-interacting GTPase 1